MSAPLPNPSLSRIYRLEATLGELLDLGGLAQGRRRIVPLTGGTFTGPELNGRLLPGSSADWQLVLPDGTALGDIRYTLQTDDGALLYVQSRGVRHGSAEVLERLARDENVGATEYTFRTSTQIETAAPALDWLNKGVFISVGGASRAPSSTRPTWSDDAHASQRNSRCTTAPTSQEKHHEQELHLRTPRIGYAHVDRARWARAGLELRVHGAKTRPR